MRKNYVSQEQFKEALKEIAEQSQTVWCLMGRLKIMFGLAFDKEANELMYQIIDNEYKEDK